MANPDHTKVLLQGTLAWNSWRLENPELQPDLRGIDLYGKYLRGADLSETNLSEAVLHEAYLYKANLIGANLREADLRGTNLNGANLNEANLNGANLSGANLREASLNRANLREAYLNGANLRECSLNKVDLSLAHLTKANLSRADLREADLREADLHEADLHEALLAGTMFAGQDLTNVKGLETIRHERPSRVDFITVTLPKMATGLSVFLQGIGASIYLMEALKGTVLPLSDKPVNVFLGFAEADQDLCQDLIDHLSLLVRSGNIVLAQKAVPASKLEVWQDKDKRAFIEAHLIIVLISASFLSSQQAWKNILEPASQRQQQGKAHLVPVILRPVTWQESWLGNLQSLPTQGRPVTEWNDHHAAFFDIATGLQRSVHDLHTTIMAGAAKQREQDLLIAELIQKKTKLASKRAEFAAQRSLIQQAETSLQQAEASLQQARKHLQETQQVLELRTQSYQEMEDDLPVLEQLCRTLTEQARAGDVSFSAES